MNSVFFSIKWIVEALAKIDNSAWISIVLVLIVLGFRLDLIEGLMAITNKPTFELHLCRALSFVEIDWLWLLRMNYAISFVVVRFS